MVGGTGEAPPSLPPDMPQKKRPAGVGNSLVSLTALEKERGKGRWSGGERGML